MKVIGTLILLLVLVVAGTVSAQTGSVVWFTSTAGTTLAANCPATPANPSICLVGNGFYIWQNATIGWCQPGISCPAPTPAAAGVTSITVCNEAGASCGAPQNGAVQLDIPKTATLN